MLSYLDFTGAEFCTEFYYFSDNAQEPHLLMRFQVHLFIYRQQQPGFWQAITGQKAKKVFLKEEKINCAWYRKGVKWFEEGTSKQASIDEEMALNSTRVAIERKILSPGELPDKQILPKNGRGVRQQVQKRDVLLG